MTTDTQQTHMRCLGCLYVLDGLPASSCPECGRAFDPMVPSTYTLRPPFVRWRFWMPGLLLAGLLGGLVGGVLILAGSFGLALTIGVPLSFGALLAYRVRVKFVFLPLLLLALIAMMFFGWQTAQLSGVFCGLILVILFSIPAIIGIGLGWGLRTVLKECGYPMAAYLPTLLLALLPLAWAAVEGPTAPGPTETVATTRHFDASPREVWLTLMFYEEVEQEPPLLLRLGLPRPLRTTGSTDSVGATKVCIYDRGHLTKRITDRRPGALLEFAVVEQQIGFERSVRLQGGSFRLEASADGGTVVTLTTGYTPQLGPRYAWRWAEHVAVHTLHRHVLDGMSASLSP